MTGISKTNDQIIKEIEECCDFDVKLLPQSSVWLNKENNYPMPDIWNTRDNAIRVITDIKYNGYTLIPF